MKLQIYLRDHATERPKNSLIQKVLTACQKLSPDNPFYKSIQPLQATCNAFVEKDIHRTCCELM